MAECATTGCTTQVRNYGRCEMHRAEHLYEATDFGEDVDEEESR